MNMTEENNEDPAEFWKRQYFRILDMYELLKTEVREDSRIDIIGQNGNSGLHYNIGEPYDPQN